MTVYVLNGPNLGRLGTRQVDVYGLTSYAQLAEDCVRIGDELGLKVVVRQTDAEAEMLGWLHAAADERAPVVLNPGAWSHYSYALRDACALLQAPNRGSPASPTAPGPGSRSPRAGTPSRPRANRSSTA